jgi:hypothetical protein
LLAVFVFLCLGVTTSPNSEGFIVNPCSSCTSAHVYVCTAPRRHPSHQTPTDRPTDRPQVTTGAGAFVTVSAKDTKNHTLNLYTLTH